MKMNAVEVCTCDGEILIIQNSGGIEQVVRINADQVKIVCKWIAEASQYVIDGRLRPDFEQE